MVKSVNHEIMDRYIRHAISVEKLGAGQARQISRHLSKDVFPELVDKLIGKLKSVDPDKLSEAWTVERLKRLTTSVDKIILAGMGRAEEALVGNLMDISDYEVEWNRLTIEKVVPVDIDFTTPNTEVLRQAVLSCRIEDKKLKTWLKAYKKSTRVEMMNAVRKGISAGESIPEIGRRVHKVANISRKQAEFIARTAVSSVVNKARKATFEKNTDLIKGEKFIATLDMRTTLVCIGFDGKEFEVGDGPYPPIHFNCRSNRIPIIKSWKEFGIKDPPPATRASMTGAVPEKITYKTWFRKQPANVQDEVLGKTRGKLYREGKVKIEGFVGKDYDTLTLDQLKRRGVKID